MSPLVPMLRDRVRSGALLGGALFVAAFFAPPWAAMLILLALTALGLWEFYSLLDAARIPNFRILGTLCGAFGLVVVWYSYDSARPDAECDFGLLALAVGFFAVFARQFREKNNPRPLETMAGTLMGLLYIGFMITFFARILRAWGGMDGRWLLIYMIAVVKFGDIGAYFIGCSIGRHKLIPRISPGKSWEGVIGGVLVAAGVSVATWLFTRGRIGPVYLEWYDAAQLGLLLAVSGVLGDLAESLLKRAAGVKDSGRLIAGMGGLLDVLDSLLPAAPILYFYARYFLEPVGVH